MMRNFEQLSALRLWLAKRVERGLHIPGSMEETTELVREDPTGFPTKMFKCVLSRIPGKSFYDLIALCSLTCRPKRRRY